MSKMLLLSNLTFYHPVVTQRDRLNYTFRPIILSLALVSQSVVSLWRLAVSPGCYADVKMPVLDQFGEHIFFMWI